MMEQITIRTATLNDLDKLLPFEQAVINTERPFDSTLKVGLIHYYDIEKMILSPDVELAVAESGAELIGCGYARIETAKPYLKHARYAYLGFMYVIPAFRGRGVNKKIIDFLSDWSLTKGLTEVRLEVYSENQPAIRAYEKTGFKRHIIEMRLGLDEQNQNSGHD